MADSIDDILIPSSDWVDAYSLSGVTVGDAIVINNKSGIKLISKITDTKPDIDDFNGPEVYARSYYYLASGESGLYLRATNSNATINVQES